MAKFPSKPQRGQKALQSIYDSLIEVIDYLPSLTINGDNKTTSVSHSSYGTIVHANQPTLSINSSKKGEEYISGRFIQITTGNVINCLLSGGTDIQIVDNRINYTGSGGGGGGSGHSYIGDKNTIPSTHIWVDQSGSDPRLISSDLVMIDDLQNYKLVSSYNILMPNSLTACNNTVDFNQVGAVYPDHFIQTKDILHDGLGTTISLAWTNNPFGTPDINYTNGIIQGLQVDLTLSGGRFADVVLHKHVVGALDPNPSIGNRYDPVDESRVDCLIMGTYDHYPHTSGFIDVVPVEQEDGKIWGVVSTNLHAGSGIAIDPQTGEITCTVEGGGGTTVIFKAPDFAKLQVQNDAGETAIGLGTTYLVPVENGSAVRYEADGGTVVAVWAPVKGSSENAHAVTTTNWSTTDDGYVRISVIDDGTLSAGCLRLFVDNKDIPLHKFARFNYSSGAIYEAGRYMDIQTTSTRINAETELEEEYTLENPIINNMLTGGTWITIQQTETVGGVEQELEYPRINCDLTAGSGIQITTGGVINNTSVLTSISRFLAQGANINLTTNQQTGVTTISAAGGSGGGGAEYTGIDPIVVNNSTHTISFNGSSMGVPWPNYANLSNYSSSLNVMTNYTAGPAGGWLRISYKGQPTSHQGQGNDAYCYGVNINGAAVGLYSLDNSLSWAGCTWILPIPPFSQFQVNFPSSPTHVYFDGSAVDYADLSSVYVELINISNNASSELYYTKQSYNSSKDYARYAKEDWDSYLTAHTAWEEEEDPDPEYEPKPSDAEDYYSWWDDADDEYRYVLQHINEISGMVTSAEEEYENMQQAGTDSQDVASWYVQKTYSYYNEAQQYATKAQAEVNKAHRYYLSACNYWGVTPQDLPNKDE